MPLRKKSPEQQAAEAAAKAQAQQEKAARERAEEAEKESQAFLASPVGRARIAFENGDHIFQYSLSVMNQKAIVVAMVGASAQQKTTDPVAVLNAVCREGWELVNGSFVFIEQGQESRDKFLSSGQNVAIKGQTVGYYLFRRCETNRLVTDAGGEMLSVTA